MDSVESVREDIRHNARQLANWMGLRGLFTVLLGILFLARPGTGVGILLGVFAAWCIVDGIALVAAAIMGDARSNRGLLALEGVVSIAAGGVTLMLPGDTAIVLLYVIAVRALIVGAIEVIAAIRLGRAIPNPWMLALTGLLSMVLGVVLARNPQAGVLSVTWVVAVYGIVLGVAELAAAFGLRRTIKQTTTPLTATPAT
jgi:uncharacterized membrane protein HdeD (DUF308 family)